MTSDLGAVDRCDFAISGVLNLAEARPLWERLAALRGKDLRIDAGAVDHLGSPCAQVLVSAFKTWQADGRTIGLSPVSEGFRESVRLLGLDHQLNSEV